jgi:signal transduction histidine kinase
VHARQQRHEGEQHEQADPDKLRQILLNLATNAIKFTPEGGTISIDADHGPGGVLIKVSDTGIGISPENLQHVFEPFFQVDQGGTRRYPGVGLGLSIVRDAALAMNGDVGVESEVGKGTTVSIRLPSADSQNAADSGQLTPTPAVSGSSTDAPAPAAMQP